MEPKRDAAPAPTDPVALTLIKTDRFQKAAQIETFYYFFYSYIQQCIYHTESVKENNDNPSFVRLKNFDVVHSRNEGRAEAVRSRLIFWWNRSRCRKRDCNSGSGTDLDTQDG
jgi:hypothetical protein